MSYGELNGHAFGIIMKEMVRRAIGEIRNQRLIFQAEKKDNPNKAGQDFVTSADHAAQKIYLRTIRECFPTAGIIAEEERTRIVCLEGEEWSFYATVDPLDGTKAYIRRQSHGIGSMVAFVRNGKVIAACVGDVMTGELYYFRPDSSRVHRLSEFDISERLAIDPLLALTEQKVLLRDDPSSHTPTVRSLITDAFKGVEVGGGSIGIAFARLWKGEIGAIVLAPATETPWDFTPVVGISEKLGFRFFDIVDGVRNHFTEATPPITTEDHRRDFETLVVHTSRVGELFSNPSFTKIPF